MKGISVLAIVVLLCSLAGADATTITYIQLGYGTGINAQYGADGGDLDWDGGNFGYIVTDGGAFTFTSANFAFNWDLSQDMSSGGNAAAWFDLGATWTIEFYDSAYGSDASVSVTGVMETTNPHFGGRYLEEELSPGTHEGATYLRALTVDVNDMWKAAKIGTDDLAWDGDDSIGLESDISFAGNVDDFDTDSYIANNGLTVFLYSDETEVIPEPMTVALLGLGGLFLRKRKA